MVLLKTVENGLLLAGPDCSSWGVPARGTSMRNFVNIEGNLFLAWVRGSSTMVSRFLVLWFLDVVLPGVLCFKKNMPRD